MFIDLCLSSTGGTVNMSDVTVNTLKMIGLHLRRELV